MYIHNTYYPYSADLKNYQSIREYMTFNVYNHIELVNEIMNLISSKIDCLDIAFDPSMFEININIKKTTMRRAKGYKVSCMYYYGLMNAVYKEFFNNHPEIIQLINKSIGINLYDFDESKFDNICQFYCIGDKSVKIRL